MYFLVLSVRRLIKVAKIEGERLGINELRTTLKG